MRKAVIYARYSTDNQNPDTIEVQVQKCADYAESHGLQIVDIFADEAISGMKSHRPELERFFSLLGSKLFECVLIYDQSRFSHDIVDWFTFRRALQSQNIQLISVTQSNVGGDLNDPMIFASEGINAIFNQMHVLQTRQKVIEKMNYMAKNAEFTGGVPCLGYDIAEKKYVVNEYEAKIVRIIFEMYSKGDSYNKIIDYLNYKGYKTKAGRSFGKNSLYAILSNEKYIGVYTYNKVKKINGKRNTHSVSEDIIKIPDALPAIIELEVWNMVSQRMNNRKWNARNRAKVEYLLSGKVECGECGAAMCGINNRNKYFYYGCTSKQRLRNCSKHQERKEVLEEKVLSAIRNFLTSEKVEVLAQNLFDSMQHVQQDTIPLQKELKKAIKEIDDQLDNINNAIAHGIYSQSTATLLKDLESRKFRLYEDLAEASKLKIETGKSVQQIIDILQFALDNADGDQLLIDLCLEKVICYDSGDYDVILNPLKLDAKRIHLSKSEAKTVRIRLESGQRHQISSDPLWGGGYFCGSKGLKRWSTSGQRHHSYAYYAKGLAFMHIKRDTD